MVSLIYLAPLDIAVECRCRWSDRYDPIIRVMSNELSFDEEAAWKDI